MTGFVGDDNLIPMNGPVLIKPFTSEQLMQKIHNVMYEG